MPIKLAISRNLPDAVLERARATYDVALWPEDRPATPAELHTLAAGCRGVIVNPSEKIGAEVIAGLPDSVEIIATFSVGFDHVDVAAAEAKGLVVTNTPEVLTEATAETTMLCMLGAARRAWEGQSILRRGEWTGWAPTQLMGWQLEGKRLGIFGMGRIGRSVARRARAFGMEIHYTDYRRLPADAEEGAVFHETPEALLAVSDVLSLHCPATPETTGFLTSERIELLPRGAIVVNTARGILIDDDALIAALKSGRLAAAGLDVFAGEPKIHPGYRDLLNAYLLPHLGSATIETRNAMGFRALDNLDAFFAGEEPPHRVRP